VAFWKLTKPRIILLLLITTVPAMVLAEGGIPSVWLIAATLVGGAMTAGGANAINQYLDRDIDEVMTRTRGRPLPSGVIEPRQALVFGAGLGLVGVSWLALTVNALAAVLAGSALAFYVLVYTTWLKRRSSQNIVIGGAAGAVPVLVGWAAVTGGIGLPAAVLFAIVFLWTPPHFWALSLKYQRDYTVAGVPMLPVVSGRAVTVRRILGYSLGLVAASLVLYPVAKLGLLYLAASLSLGALFLALASRLRATGSTPSAMRLFKFSILYLTLLFASVAADTLLRLRA
jgi:protoheme IX farnesyltransferase